MVEKGNNILTLEQVCGIIENKIIEIRTYEEPRWGWNRNHIGALLRNLIIEMEKECRNN